MSCQEVCRNSRVERHKKSERQTLIVSLPLRYKTLSLPDHPYRVQDKVRGNLCPTGSLEIGSHSITGLHILDPIC